MVGGLPDPSGVAQQDSSQKHGVGLFTDDDFFGLIGLGDHSDRGGGNLGLLANLYGEGHLIARAHRNLGIRRGGAGRDVRQVDTVNVASVRAWWPVGASYGVSKAAMWTATDSMRLELAPRGVQVVGVYVGLVDTDMADFTDSPKADPADVIRQVLDGIESGADEVLADELTRRVRAQLGESIHARLQGASNTAG